MSGSWREAVACTEAERALLPRGYDVVGHVVLVRLPDGLDHLHAAIGQALLDHVPAARTVAADRGVEGELRTRDIAVIAGEPTLLAEHREHGARLLVDLAHCYFSPRLAGERERVTGLVGEGERMLDMYCGVGPYAVLAARRGADVLGLELNAHAVRLARENARRNKVGGAVDVVLADAPRLTRVLEPAFDRIVMNLPHDAVDHLADALPAAAPGCTLHVGAMLPRDDVDARAQAIAREHGLALLDVVHVRNYNPAVWHVSLEMRFEG